MSLLTVILLVSACTFKQPADLILHHGKVYTVDSAFSTAEAFAVKDGKIIAVGSEDDILAHFTSDSMVDAQGRAVYPGLIDAHSHFISYSQSLFTVDLFGCTSIQEVVRRVKEFALEHPNEAWILGRGWDQNKFPGKAFPDNTLLNQAFPKTAVALSRVDGHALLANAKALAIAGVHPGEKLSGGSIETKNGRLTGIMIDNARDLVLDKVPKPAPIDYEKWLLAGQKKCFTQGLTTVSDMGINTDEIQQLDNLQHAGKLKMRLYVLVSDNEKDLHYWIPKGPYKTNRLYVKGVKAYADGALGSRGACLLQPYSDQPGWYGFLLSSLPHYDSLAQMLSKTEFQLCTHAIGDSGNRMILTVYAKYLHGKNDRRWRVEHAQVINPADFALFGQNSIIPSVQPTHATSDMYWAADRLGPERIKGAYAFRDLLAQNGWIALGTDFPVEDISPFKTFLAAVFRVDAKGYPRGGFQPENALSREETIRGMTIWAAKAGFLENEVGSLEKGKKADFIILDRDLMTVSQDSVLATKVAGTWSGGEKVY